MRIALVLPHELETEDNYIPSGIYRYTMGLAGALGHRGHTVWILSKSNRHLIKACCDADNNIRRHNFTVDSPSRFSFAEQIHEFCLSENVDVIEAHQSQFPLFLEQIIGRTATVTRYASGFTDSILAGDFNFDEVGPSLGLVSPSEKDLVWTEHLCEQHSVRNADLVMCASIKMAQRAHELGCTNIHLVPLGINKFSTDFLDNKNSTILISAVRFNDSRKGGDLVENIVRNIPEGYKITVLGEMTAEHTELRCRLLALGALVIDKPLSYSDLQKLYRETQFCIVPTKSESFGYNLLEPLSYGIPTICFDQDDPSKKDWPLFYLGDWRTANLKESLSRIFNSLESNYLRVRTASFDFAKQYEWEKLIERY